MPAKRFGIVVLIIASFVLITPRGAAAGDGRVRAEAADALQRSAQVTIFDEVAVEVENGILTIDGYVTSERKKGAIEAAVAAVPGVDGVQNRLRVLAESAADDRLREELARAIYDNSAFWSYAMMPSPSIRIIVEHGHVTLSGSVRTESDRSLARALATQSSARSITMNLAVERAQTGRR